MSIDLLANIKEGLHFYQVLGFESLPIKLSERGKRPPSARKLNGQTAPDKEILLKKLREEIGDCRKCKLSGKRMNIVFGEGNPGARGCGQAPYEAHRKDGIHEGGCIHSKYCEMQASDEP
jgi:hypothetical protein